MEAKLISSARELHLFPAKFDLYLGRAAKINSNAAFPSRDLISSTGSAMRRPLATSFSSSSSRSARSSVRAAANAIYAPRQSERESFYELLGISEGGTLPEIKKAYKQLARKYHPDVSPPERTEEYTKRFIMVQEAYETLSDPHSRALYDRDLAPGLHFAFSSSRIYAHPRQRSYDEYEAEEWKKRWLSQLNELRMRCTNGESKEKMSWAARMRRKRNDIFDLGFN